MQILELKIPPPLLCIACMLLMYAIQPFFPLLDITLPFANLVLLSSLLLGGCVSLSGLYEFKKAKTTIHPIKVERVSRIVDCGVYRFTRNPMYLGLLLLLFGYGYWQQNLLNLLICAGFVAYMNRFQIKPEEVFLEQKFGKAYTEYKARVRRWV